MVIIKFHEILCTATFIINLGTYLILCGLRNKLSRNFIARHFLVSAKSFF